MFPHRIGHHVVGVVFLLLSSSLTIAQAQQLSDGSSVRLVATISAGDGSGPSGTSPPTLFFGAALSLHRRELAVGMPAYDHAIGRVALFGRDQAGNWNRVGTLDPADRTQVFEFGRRVAIRGDEALVASSRGVHVFRQYGNQWRQVQLVPATAAAPLEGDLALSEDEAFVGTSVAAEPGQVRILAIDRLGRLRLHRVIASPAGDPADEFGSRLSVADGKLLVGAPGDSAARGAAYLFEHYGIHWFERQKLIAIDGKAGDSFGVSVAVSDDVIAIGAPRAARDPDQFFCFVGYAGAVYTFERHRGTWFEHQTLLGPPKCTESFGDQVALGRRWLATSTPTSFPLYDGSTFIYQQQGREFVPSGGGAGSETGPAILALSGSTLVVGLPFDRFFSTGYALIYELE